MYLQYIEYKHSLEHILVPYKHIIFYKQILQYLGWVIIMQKIHILNYI